MNGYGVYIWPDGKKYEGEFLNDKRNGEGIMNFPDGRTYDGGWKDDV